MSALHHARRAVARAGKKWPHVSPALTQPKENEAPIVIDKAHFEPMGSWSSEKMQSSQAENPFILTWVPGKNRDAIPHISHGEGIYIFDSKGDKFIDWTSQAVCTNLGHDLPETVVEAAAEQMRQLPFLYGGIGIPEVRIRTNQLMNEILPGNLQAAVFPSSGAEANEAGIMMARRYTGRHKVMSWYRSYHGATGNTLSSTGDMRRWYGKEQNAGFVKAFNPFPLFWDWAGDTEEERTQQALNMLEEQILNEGPETIASIMTESIVGAGGCLVMPPGYMQGVRAICDKYGILMHFDEVMVGFGRTGKFWGFQNYPGVMPDIVTAGKGISSSSVPLSMTACSKPILDFFDDKPLGWGSTYQAHGVALACAYENLKYLIKEDVIGHVQKLAPTFEAQMERLTNNHESIKQYRSVGLFGCMDVHDSSGNNPRLQHHPAHEAFATYKKAYKANGLVGLHRYPHIHVAPPLIISEEELLDGFERHDAALHSLDEALAGN
mmetsp:Transcript_43717/g.64179  ORF Transcript_43717/g.64179 Transcript_43717/m.64179 type:complete len:494 (-) Transcript_43717:264-1745(-)|eukprot:CAMPEP_0195520272 /NCGR_PEP_ID=MMETSP0794_2-20130614/16511_1 /TAXON_ID=515487 /ORGANISM="Stephanopyxis turris, Strain CCMP 815" /LENGTH=493 /DNA_ID=CAMNT_0040649597 /DNA_START=51 /DNA_END=1532 /DNA_ORIENTATION=+